MRLDTSPNPRFTRLFVFHVRSFVLFSFIVCLTGCSHPRRHEPVGPHPVEFVYWNPTAQQVFLAGDFNGWNTTANPMHQANNKEWLAEITLKPGRHQYKFIADGHWTQDPANRDSAPDLFGGKNSVLIVNPGAHPDGQSERKRISADAHRMLEEQDFAGIEKRAAKLRHDKVRLRQGRWELQPFYEGLNLSDYLGSDEANWRDALAKLDAWHSQFPSSITEPVVRAHVLVGYAWKARGTGWASEVSNEGWDLMHDRLKQARESLDAAAKLPGRCPEWYSAMQSVALGQGWNRVEYEKLFQEAVAHEPSYYDYFFNKAYYLTPRWFGNTGEWERFADDAAIHYDPQEGLALYSRIAWSKNFLFGNIFRESDIRWPRMRNGFRDIMNQWPESIWNLNNFCWFACKAGDQKSAKQLFEEIGDEFDYDVWHSRSQFLAAKRWAAADPNSPSVHAIYRHTARYATRATAIAPRRDAKGFYIGYGDGVLTRWDSDPNHRPEDIGHYNRNILHIAVPPTGSLVAIALDEKDNKSGEVRILEPSERKERTTIADWSGAPYDVSFSANSGLLVAVGGRSHKPGIAKLWTAGNGTTENVSWPAPKHLLVTSALSPDGRLLMTNDDSNLRVWDLRENRMVFKMEKDLPELVLGVAFSPDGKWAAAACAQDSWESDEPGHLLVWNVADWSEVKRVPLNCGAEHVVFSPDARYLAASRRDNTVTLWNTKDWAQAAEFLPVSGYISGLAFSTSGNDLAISTFDDGFSVWHVQ
jgi:WD40 repeat protein